ncbi:sigma-54 interaction domain-containing protein [Modicisalibacter zincidurans]|uniref:Sigma-54 factor interaction domain-containing protein n=1 Tax=Modicisalibacter zincidurans TaxID=1178777 RepID=A0ABP9R908_9GAMM|nr:sigma-54 dependent transcriptional regulator [Halomonas zincidurans]
MNAFIGDSLPMKMLYKKLKQVSCSDAPVFISGESGTGKELCASVLHKYGKRHQGPFIAVNCAAIPSELFESQLFGHLRGAFTGASCDRDGYTMAADGGTLFLDEVAELSLDVQSKLLRFLQTGQVIPVGATAPRVVDCRIVCATNVDPSVLVREGRFREDLYYRLHVIPVALPPLRDRGDDIVEIARALVARYAGSEGKAFQRISHQAELALRCYSWPGNVRELENVIRRAVVMHDGEQLTEHMLELSVAARRVPLPPTFKQVPDEGSSAHVRPLWMIERDAIEHAIAACGGNIQRAAALLEVAPSTLYRKRLVWKTS